jgi:hypothetical protein
MIIEADDRGFPWNSESVNMDYVNERRYREVTVTEERIERYFSTVEPLSGFNAKLLVTPTWACLSIS